MVCSATGGKFFEEINIAIPGASYGWPRREGPLTGDGEPLPTPLPSDDDSQYPITGYHHEETNPRPTALALGGVIRGGPAPALDGKIVFANLVDGTLFVADASSIGSAVADGQVTPDELVLPERLTMLQVDGQPTTLIDLLGSDRVNRADARFGTDAAGNLYVFGKYTGEIYRFVDPNAVDLLRITETGGTTLVAEGGREDSFAVSFLERPSAPVELVISTDDNLVVSPGSVTITPDDYAQSRVVSVRAVDDTLVEGRATSFVEFTANSADPRFADAAFFDLPVVVQDNDVDSQPARTELARFVSTKGGTAVAESGEVDQFSIVFETRPSGPIEIDILADRDLFVSPRSFTISPIDYAEPRVISVGAVDDDLAEGAHVGAIRLKAVGADTNFLGAEFPSLFVEVTDNDFDDRVRLRGGDDVFDSGGGDDRVWGDAGDDDLSGGKGKDRLYGGKGDNKLYGGSGKDKLRGDDGKDRLAGQKGDDKLYGGKGKDSLRGGDHDDKLYGGSGKDKLRGDDGKDRLAGQKGDDKLYGGKGRDSFVYEEGDGTDRIYDFVMRESVRLKGFDDLRRKDVLDGLEERGGNSYLDLDGEKGSELIFYDVTDLSLHFSRVRGASGS